MSDTHVLRLKSGHVLTGRFDIESEFFAVQWDPEMPKSGSLSEQEYTDLQSQYIPWRNGIISEQCKLHKKRMLVGDKKSPGKYVATLFLEDGCVEEKPLLF